MTSKAASLTMMLDPRCPAHAGRDLHARNVAGQRLNGLLSGRRIDDASLSDCVAVRDALDALVCREAAAVCTPDDAAALRAIVDRMGSSSTAAEAIGCGRTLHRRIATLATNEMLRTTYFDLLDYVRDDLCDRGQRAGFDIAADYAIHRELAEAVIEGEPTRLAAAVAAHAGTPAPQLDSTNATSST
ncbi:MAG TPA: FCD domain-containing protein [Solirubrobacteraceae bacterium]|nr:FCD domain-containing protein [Solirubrobacteraceae bacterium]